LRVYRTIPAALVVGLMLLATACGDSSGGATTTTAKAATTTAEATTTTAAAETTTTGADVQAQAQAALLTAADLPAGFTDLEWTDSNDPPPCAAAGTESVDDQLPPQLVVGSLAQNDAIPAVFLQEIRLYSSEAEAANSVGLGTAGLDCPVGTVANSDGTTTDLNIAAPQDVSADVGVDSATAWAVTSDQFVGTLVAVQLGAAVVTFQFETTPEADTTALGDPLDAVKAGIQKIANS
jgi:hypothetical protein